MTRRAVLAAVLLLLAAAAPAAPLKVAVTIAPQAWLVEKVGDGHVAVVTAVAPGESPHAFDPTPRHVARLADAAVYFAVGVPAENLLVPRLRAGAPGLDVVDTAVGLRPPAHGDAHDHGHDDPHVWLAPQLLARQAARVADALARHDPAHAAFYAARRDSLQAELARLDRELAAALAPVRGRAMYVLHPAYGAFADAYGLHQVSIEPPGGDPSPRRLTEVVDRVRAGGARAVFTQPEVSQATARAVARACGVALVTLDPLAPDVAANLRRMAAAVREALADA